MGGDRLVAAFHLDFRSKIVKYKKEFIFA
jgi:hypothetical protein